MKGQGKGQRRGREKKHIGMIKEEEKINCDEVFGNGYNREEVRGQKEQ